MFMFYTPRHVVLAALHVDDCGIDYHKEDTEIVDKIVTEFKKEWKVTDADPRKFLGFDLRFEKEGLFLCADTAEQESAEKWGLMRSNPKKAPTPSGAEPPIGCERDEEVDPRTILAAAGEFGYPGHVCRRYFGAAADASSCGEHTITRGAEVDPAPATVQCRGSGSSESNLSGVIFQVRED